MEPTNISCLPAEMILAILSFIESIKDINSFRQTCKFNNAVVLENDMSLLRPVEGKTPWSCWSEPRIGKYTVSPRGVLHGLCETTFREIFSCVNYVNGELDGVETAVYKDKTVERGLWRNDKRIGLWKGESLEYRETGLGTVWAEFYDEGRFVYSHERTGVTDMLTVATEVPNVEIRYIHEQFEPGEEFYCEEGSEMHYSGFVKYIFENGENMGVFEGPNVFYTCCEEHYGDMPAHLADLRMIEDPDNRVEIPRRTPKIDYEFYEYEQDSDDERFPEIDHDF
nr:f-box containing protein [Marseillevirus cajuinensis]